MMKSKGFTLIEVMIVLAILSTLTVLASRSLQDAIRSKIKIQNQIDDMSQVRDALRVMERDINLAFHYSDLELEMNKLIREKRKASCTGGTNTPAANNGGVPTTTTTTTTGSTAATAKCPPLDSQGCAGPEDPLCQKGENRLDPVTQFIGKEQEMAFITMNTSRMSEASQQADFVKVGYSLGSCKRVEGLEEKTTPCLLRRSSIVADGDVLKGGDFLPLLYDVESFKLKYMTKGKEDWSEGWDSVQGDSSQKNKYPDLVEISLSINRGTGDKKKVISMQLVASVRFPNNPETKKNANANGGAAGGTGTQGTGAGGAGQ